MKDRPRVTLIIAIVGLLLGLALLLHPRWRSDTRAFAYGIHREYGRAHALASLDGYLTARSEHFSLYYRAQDADAVNLILETAEGIYGPVVTRLQRRAAENVPILLYASRRDMRSAFGWGNGESALGVYWKGTIRLLSPNVWIGQKSEETRNRVFQRMNPIAHELTHYILDHETSGNYPRWFSEGLAQWVEYHVSGYLWIESGSSLRQPLYTLDDLAHRFEALPNQALAYRQAYLLVSFMDERFGSESVLAIVGHLQGGQSFDAAVQKALGQPMPLLVSDWQAWLETNLDRLEFEADNARAGTGGSVVEVRPTTRA